MSIRWLWQWRLRTGHFLGVLLPGYFAPRVHTRLKPRNDMHGDQPRANCQVTILPQWETTVGRIQRGQVWGQVSFSGVARRVRLMPAPAKDRAGGRTRPSTAKGPKKAINGR